MNWAIDFTLSPKPQQGEASLYGVIIYTDQHPYVKKMLTDADLWQALDSISGPHWVVLAAHGASGSRQIEPPPPGTLRRMQAIWREPAENAELLDAFELASSECLPVLVVFAVANDGTVLKKSLKISCSSANDAYESLSNIFKAVARSLAFMDDQYRRIDGRAFNVVTTELRHFEAWEYSRKAAAVLKSLKEWLC